MDVSECIRACNSAYRVDLERCLELGFFNRFLWLTVAEGNKVVCYAGCYAAEGLSQLARLVEAADQWVREHPYAAAGTVVAITGVLMIVTFNPVGGVMLVSAGSRIATAR